MAVRFTTVWVNFTTVAIGAATDLIRPAAADPLKVTDVPFQSQGFTAGQVRILVEGFPFRRKADMLYVSRH